MLALAVNTIGGSLEREKEITAALEDKKVIIPNKIAIVNKNIEIPLGDSDYLIVETEPLELNPNDLFYLSFDPDIAHMENIHSRRIIATAQLSNNMVLETDILVHDLNGSAQDKAHVYITKKVNSGSLRIGKNKDTDTTGDKQ